MPDGLRIAYIINSLEGGGAALPVPAVAGVLANQGATVEIFALTRRNGRALEAMETAGLVVHVRDGGEKDHRAATAWLNGQLALFRPDILWTSLTRATLLGQIVGRWRRTPVVSWQHNAYLKPANLFLLRATQRLSRLWIGDSDSVTALTAARLGVPPDRLASWPLFAADADAAQARPWRPGEPLKLGSLGRLHPAKGYDVLIAALARMRAEGFQPPVPFEIHIGGEGAEREALEAQLHSAGIDKVRLAGYVEQPGALLADLHLYLQPSRREGLCIAAHEAMQAGLPVVASAVGQLAYSIQPGITGLLVPPEKPDALAQTLVDLLSSPERLAAMGAASRERVLDRFSSAAFARAGAEIVARLAG
jgi:glycosyltransferase involved in cell wall biosynthesis